MSMKASTFFKILNKKIEKYDKMATNPFTVPQPIVFIWVEEDSNDDTSKKLEGK